MKTKKMPNECFVSVSPPSLLRFISVVSPIFLRRISTECPPHLHRMSTVSVDIRWRCGVDVVDTIWTINEGTTENQRRWNVPITEKELWQENEPMSQIWKWSFARFNIYAYLCAWIIIKV
ncbi:MAG: hypothetical protein IKQ72_13330 [Bacteroidaceae bacterium]|nr:hypothetical protein [Bacteroidaceae bacterium]